MFFPPADIIPFSERCWSDKCPCKKAETDLGLCRQHYFEIVPPEYQREVFDDVPAEPAPEPELFIPAFPF